jgi:hypothetical protein
MVYYILQYVMVNLSFSIKYSILRIKEIYPFYKKIEWDIEFMK